MSALFDLFNTERTVSTASLRTGVFSFLPLLLFFYGMIIFRQMHFLVPFHKPRLPLFLSLMIHSKRDEVRQADISAGFGNVLSSGQRGTKSLPSGTVSRGWLQIIQLSDEIRPASSPSWAILSADGQESLSPGIWQDSLSDALVLFFKILRSLRARRLLHFAVGSGFIPRPGEPYGLTHPWLVFRLKSSLWQQWGIFWSIHALIQIIKVRILPNLHGTEWSRKKSCLVCVGYFRDTFCIFFK